MTKELIIDFKDKIPRNIATQRFDFYDDEGKLVPLHKLFGKTTTWPDWSYGLTREINGHTWWIVNATTLTHTGSQTIFKHIDMNNNVIGTIATFTIPVHQFTTQEQRALIQLTREEAETIGHPYTDYCVAVRDDSIAWDLFYGDKTDDKLPINLTIKTISNAINNYINVTKPKQKTQKKAIEKAKETKAAKLIPISDLSIPKKINKSNGTYVFAKMLNDLNHNQKAIINMILQLHK